MKKKLLFTAIIFTMSVFCLAQEVEKIAILEDVKYERYPGGGMGHFPLGIYFNEVNNLLVVQDPSPGTIVTINLETKAISKEEKPLLSEHAPLLLILGNDYWGVYSDSIEYSINNTPHFNKQVWYTDEGKTSGEIKLPAHRRKLVEMIQKLEKQ